MEVHAHSHTHGKKNWKSYFWEFLMLFLAVFCGFLAEYQLEHKIEKERSRQYIFSFYEDLKKDTTTFSGVIRSYEVKINAFKDRESCYKSLSGKNKSDACLFPLISNSESFTDLVYSEGTMQQLKNAGGLRLLSKNEADSILVYDNLLRTYVKHETSGFQDVQNSIRGVMQSMIKYDFLIHPDTSSAVPILYTTNPDLINKYFILLEGYNTRCIWGMEDMKQIKIKAINLIEYFKTKYHLK